MRQLAEAEGPGTALEGELKALLVEVKNVDPDKADRRAGRFESKGTCE